MEARIDNSSSHPLLRHLLVITDFRREDGQTQAHRTQSTQEGEVGVKIKRGMAGWNNDDLLKVLGL